MKIFNTLKKIKEDFKPIKRGEIKMYVCGPTVYDVGHLGHGRAAVVFDVIRKYFEYKGYKVIFVTNYTDIDDKMINRAEELGISVTELAEKIIPEYKKDFAELCVAEPTKQTRATFYIKQMISLIRRLDKKGVTYRLDDGIYFDISKFKEYGKLSGQNLKDLLIGARVEINENKKNPQDFVLWKFNKPKEPGWDSPWGNGRPGWHIECSAMIFSELGESIDIHGGGQDLIFPHHECEIAQSESASGRQFVRYWMHNGFVNINKEKMSKSLKNFVTLKDVFNKYPGRVLRFMYLQKHYRAPLDFSWDLIESAKNGLARIHEFIVRLEKYQPAAHDKNDADINIDIFLEKFEKAMDDDFETPMALAALFDFINNVNKAMEKGFSVDMKNKVMFVLKRIDDILCFIFPNEKISDEIIALANERLIERQNKNFDKADAIRKKIVEKGYEIEDTKDGYILKRL